MKRLLLLVFLMLIDIECTHYSLQSCPTCVGNAHDVSAPFFSDECYQDSALTNFSSFDMQETNTSSLLE